MTKLERNKKIYSCHKKGKSQKEIGEFFGLCQSAVSKIVIAERKGTNTPKEETRGVKRRLTDSQLEQLKLYLSKSPTEYAYKVWDKWSVQSLIMNKFGIKYHENYIWKIMRFIKFSSQKPQAKDYRQDPEKVAHFKENKIPQIKKKVVEENRLLAFQDEAAVRLLPCTVSTYAPIGQTPQLLCDEKNKDYVSVSGVISPDGYAYFEVREKEGFKQKSMTRFLDNLWADAKCHLFIVWDNASSHKSKTIKAYLKAQSDDDPKIWLDNTPPYSPELNPIEQVWACLKKRLRNHFVETTRELKQIVTNTLEEIKADKELIKSFFKHKELKCYHFFN